MTATDLLQSLRDAGLFVRTDGQRILIEPKGKLTAEQTELIITNRKELLAQLLDEDARAKALDVVPHGWDDPPLEIVRLEDDPPEYVALPAGYLDFVTEWARTRPAPLEKPAKKKAKPKTTEKALFEAQP